MLSLQHSINTHSTGAISRETCPLKVGDFRVRVFNCLEALQPYRDQWDQLACDNPMLGWSWLSNWWLAFQHRTWKNGTKALAVATVWDSNNQLRGLAPCYVATNSTSRMLRFLGDGKVSSDYLRILTCDGDENEVSGSIAAWIVSSDFTRNYGSIDGVVIEGHLLEEPTLRMLQGHLANLGWHQNLTPLEGAWKTEIPESWEQLQKRFCKAQRRKANKINRLREEGKISIQWDETPEKITQAWPEFVRLHQLRRRALGEHGCFADPQFEEFLFNAISELSSVGRARLGLIRSGQNFIGVTLLLGAHNRVMMYQSGMDPAFNQFEPGHVANYLSLEWATKTGKTSFDFLRGDEPYKKGWAAERTPLFCSRLISPRWSARVKHTLWQTARHVKQVAHHCRSKNSSPIVSKSE